MIKLLSNRVWPDITRELTGAVRTIGAISYVGDAACELVPLKNGDSIIVDGTDNSLKNGTVSPKAVRKWIKAGVHVYSLSGLHAKIVVAEKSGNTSVLIIGSANASATSRDSKVEASIVCSDEGAVDEARNLIHEWLAASGAELDDVWLAHADQIYRPQRRESRRRKANVSLDRDRMWIGTLENGVLKSSSATESAILRTEGEFSDVAVNAWLMDSKNLKLMRVGDTVVLAGAPPGKTPHGNASVGPPARVVRLIPPTGRYAGAAIYAYDINWARARHGQVTRSLAGTNWSYDQAVTSRASINKVLGVFGL